MLSSSKHTRFQSIGAAGDFGLRAQDPPSTPDKIAAEALVASGRRHLAAMEAPPRLNLGYVVPIDRVRDKVAPEAASADIVLSAKRMRHAPIQCWPFQARCGIKPVWHSNQ